MEREREKKINNKVLNKGCEGKIDEHDFGGNGSSDELVQGSHGTSGRFIRNFGAHLCSLDQSLDPDEDGKDLRSRQVLGGLFRKSLIDFL